jgi:hypothetical protein
MNDTQHTPNDPLDDDSAAEPLTPEFDAAALPASEPDALPDEDGVTDATESIDNVDDIANVDNVDSLDDADYDALDDEYEDDEDDEYLDDADYEDDEDDALDELADMAPLGASSDIDLDVDAALAALGSLDAVMSEHAAQERVEADRLEAEQRAEDEYQRWVASYQFDRPGMIRAQAGRPATIAPAIGLMALGALLTLGTTSGGISAGLLAVAVAAALGLALVSYWLTSARWARGALFIGLSALGIAVVLALPLYANLALPWSAPLIVLGVALLLTGWLARQRSGRLVAIGLAVAGASAVAGLTTLPVVLSQAAPFILVAAGVLLVLPLVLRRGARA